jgi:hypothetical protein
VPIGAPSSRVEGSWCRCLSTTPRDQQAVNGQVLLSAAGQILLATDTGCWTNRRQRVKAPLIRCGRGVETNFGDRRVPLLAVGE